MYKRSHGRVRSRSRSPAKRSESRSRAAKKYSKHEKERDERRRQKELMKATETAEEKRARRQLKKETKQRRLREKMGWDQEMMGYTNADNPFGDQHLLEKFVWQKKRDQEVEQMKLSEPEIERRERQRQEEMRRELEKVKKRRLEREKEREQREEEMTLLQRMREAEMFKEWEDQEDKFHLEQAKLRSRIRIESGRAKPIDLLAKYINTLEEDMDIEMQEPYYLLRGLNVVDLEDLMEDIKVYLELENESHRDYWKDVTIICEDELQKLKRLEQIEYGGADTDRREGVNPAVTSDVVSVFKGKTHSQLLALEDKINQRISSGDAVDIGYWESLLQQLKAHMARARLRDKHQAILRKKLFQLKQEQAEQFGLPGTPLFPGASVMDEEYKVVREMPGEQEPDEMMTNEDAEECPSTGKEVVCLEARSSFSGINAPPGIGEAGPSGSGGISGIETNQADANKDKIAAEESETLIDEEDLLQQAYVDYENGAYSPKLLKPADIPEEIEVVADEEDYAQRTASRSRVTSGSKDAHDFSHLKMSRSIGGDGMAEEEYTFNSEVALEAQNYIWQGKYRPRKPRFFNRVHTGFEWNKYNQTHYDTDNPPPKIVQGYKFNIFYPDLIDKRKTPSFSVTPCKDNPEFSTLRFEAGPPYEDIAFKIVNREWEYSWKHGFKNQFQNNILQLWFRFKRYRYRR